MNGYRGKYFVDSLRIHPEDIRRSGVWGLNNQPRNIDVDLTWLQYYVPMNVACGKVHHYFDSAEDLVGGDVMGALKNSHMTLGKVKRPSAEI